MEEGTMLVKCPKYNKDDEQCFGCTHNVIHKKDGDCLKLYSCGAVCIEATSYEVANFNYDKDNPHCPYCGVQQKWQKSDLYHCCDCDRDWTEYYKFSHIELEK